MSRGTTMERAVEFFRTADLDVAEITLAHCGNIVSRRLSERAKSNASNVAALSAPRKPRRSRKGASLSTATGQPPQAGIGQQSGQRESIADA